MREAGSEDGAAECEIDETENKVTVVQLRLDRVSPHPSLKNRDDDMRGVPASLVTCRSMNILIEDAEKLEYLTSNSGWTKNPADGRNFGSTGSALAAAKKEPLGKFNIVSYIAQTKQFINLNHGKGKGTEMVAG